MLPHRRTSLSDPQDLRSSIPVYVPGYPECGRNLLCFSTFFHTIPYCLPVYIQQSFPAFQTDVFCIHHALQFRVPLFLFCSMENNWSVFSEVSASEAWKQ